MEETPQPTADREELRPPAWLGWALVLQAGLLFVLLRSRFAFLGDNFLRVHEAEVGTGSPNEIGVMAVYHVLVEAGRAHFGLEAREVFVGVSVAAGLLYAWVGWKLACRLAFDLGSALLIWAGLLTAGSVELFCGYVEVYPLVQSMLLLAVWGGVLAATKRLPPYVPILILAVATALHRVAVLWTPAILGALWLNLGVRRQPVAPSTDPSDPTSAPNPAGSALPIGSTGASPARRLASWEVRWVPPALGILVTGIALVLVGRTPLLLPLFPQPERAYALLSVPHLSDYLNAQFLGSVAGFLLLPLALVRFWRNHDPRPEEWVLLLSWWGPACALFFFRPSLGGSDWDLLSLAAPFSVLFASAVLLRPRSVHSGAPMDRGSERNPTRRERWLRPAVAMAVLLSALNTGAWLLVQAGDGSIARIRDLVESDRADYYRGHPPPMQLGFLFGANGLPDLQREELRKGMAAHPRDPRYPYNLAVLARGRQQWEEAERLALRAYEIEPSYLPPLDLLYDVYRAQRRKEDQLSVGRAILEAHRTQRDLVGRYLPRARIEQIAREVAGLSSGQQR